MATSTTVSYRYILTNLLTNKVIAEVPFVGVTWGRSLKSAGSFSGDIPVVPETSHLDLYNTTMPAKTGLYVLRNDVCVWGGIIWSRVYDGDKKTLSVTGLEFTSYFAHRKIWKTFTSSFDAKLVVPNESGADATVTLKNDTFNFEPNSDVYISFTGDYINLSGLFKVGSTPSNSSFQFNPADRSYILNKVSLKKGVATFYTKTEHGLSLGDNVTVSGVSLDTKKYPNVQDRMIGTQTVTKIPTSTSFTAKIDVDQAIKIAKPVKQSGRVTANGSLPPGTYSSVTVSCAVNTYEFTRRMVDAIATDFNGINFPNNAIKPGISYEVDVTGYGRQANIVTITTSEPHELSEGQKFTVQSLTEDLNGEHNVLEVVDENTVTFESEGEAFPFQSVSTKTVYITKRFRRGRVITYTTSTAHSFNTGDFVTITKVPSTKIETIESAQKRAKDIAEATDAKKSQAVINEIKNNIVYTTYVFNGSFQIVGTPSTTSFGVRANEQKDDSKKSESISPAGVATVTPVIKVASYGSYTNNADIGITFDEDFSSTATAPKIIRGFELQTLNKILETYSDDIDGFDYRIDCEYDAETQSFLRIFKFVPRQFPNAPIDGSVSPITRFGAEKNVFEYPGNVNSVKMEENAENAATRFFAVGSKSGSGTEESAPYSGAAADDLLADGWILLDEDEKIDGESREEVLYQWADRYLFESRPPVGEISITVNGSIDPVIGDYLPGDWCSLVIDDDFVRQRLANGLEPRDDVIVRKILGYSVKVKDALGVPEEVNITLVPDWEVDTFAK